MGTTFAGRDMRIAARFFAAALGRDGVAPASMEFPSTLFSNGAVMGEPMDAHMPPGFILLLGSTLLRRNRSTGDMSGV